MLREDDYLFGPVYRLAQAVSRESPSAQEVDATLRGEVGLDLRTLDALTASALITLLAGDDDRAVMRRSALADALEALAAPGPDGDDRRAKARALRG
jgi:hypothetical protein